MLFLKSVIKCNLCLQIIGLTSLSHEKPEDISQANDLIKMICANLDCEELCSLQDDTNYIACYSKSMLLFFFLQPLCHIQIFFIYFIVYPINSNNLFVQRTCIGMMKELFKTHIQSNKII